VEVIKSMRSSNSQDRAEKTLDSSLNGNRTSPVGRAFFVKSKSVPSQSQSFTGINRGHIPSGSETYRLVIRELTYQKQCDTDMTQQNGIKPRKSSIKSPGCKSSQCQVQWADNSKFRDTLKATREMDVPQSSEG
jgi:hypothetical protein